jgi:hypothetical protein
MWSDSMIRAALCLAVLSIAGVTEVCAQIKAAQPDITAITDIADYFSASYLAQQTPLL